MPTDMSTLKGKAQQTNGGYYLSTTNDVYMTFNADGTVKYRTGTTGAWTTKTLTALAGTNQVIVIDGGNLHIKGKLNGQVTVAALSSSTSKGMVYIDSSVSYNTNPVTTPTSTDILGIVATNDIMIKDTTYNNTSAGITIQAAMFSQNGGFGADHYDTRASGVNGSIHLLGGISQKVRNAVGTSGSPGTGFKKSYYYDNRMLVTAPPSFPTTGSYEILEWLD
jgi:hypothetical protein